MAAREVLAERAAGRRPSRLRSALAAAAVGAVAALLTYRVLRSGANDDA
jgi:hypothetical protein